MCFGSKHGSKSVNDATQRETRSCGWACNGSKDQAEEDQIATVQLRLRNESAGFKNTEWTKLAGLCASEICCILLDTMYASGCEHERVMQTAGIHGELEHRE